MEDGKLRYVVARPGLGAPGVTYLTEEIASRYADIRDRVVPVRVRPHGLEALDDHGAAALEGVFLREEWAHDAV